MPRVGPVHSFESEAFVPSPMSDAGDALQQHHYLNAPYVTGFTDGATSRVASYDHAAVEHAEDMLPVGPTVTPTSNSDHTPDVSEIFAISISSTSSASSSTSSEVDKKHSVLYPSPFKRRVHDTLGSIVTNAALSVQYTRTDVARRPRNCVLGFLAVFLVVFFTMIALATISKTKFLLLRFAELSVGEMDAVVYTSSGVPVVNYTAVADRFSQNASETVSGSAPRWIAQGTLRKWKKSKAATNASSAKAAPYIAVNMVVIDAEKEPVVGIGRAWPYRQVGYGEAHVTDTALDYLSLQSNIGDRSTLMVDVGELLSGQGFSVPTSAILPNITVNTSGSSTSAFSDATVLEQSLNAILPASTMTTIDTNTSKVIVSGATINLTSLLSPSVDINIADGITGTFGKFPMSLGNVMVIDYHLLPQLVADQAGLGGTSVFTPSGDATDTASLLVNERQQQANAAQSLLDTFDVSNYALMVVAMFHNRFQTYYKSSGALARDMIRNSNEMLLALDYTFSGSIVYPVAAAMNEFESFNALITSLFAAMVIIILVLSAILVYSLLGMHGEERQFELAMIRAQGMTRTQLLYVMSGEVAVFVAPGVCCGVGLAIAANAIIERILSDFVKAPYEPFRIPVYAYVVGVVAGVLLPIVSNWTPVVEAMRASLRDALDVHRQKWSESHVSMVKLEDFGLELWQTLLGLFLTVAGFMVYYLLPMAYLNDNLLVFFMIMNIVLLIMLFGLCLIAFSLQGVVSEVWLRIVLRGPDKRLSTLVTKNMEAHAAKSQRAFVMFILAIASVVYGGIAFNFLSDGMSQTLELSSGADFLVTSSSFDDPLNRTTLDAYLASQQGLYVASWSYVTFTLTAYPQVTPWSGLRTVLGTSTSMPIVGVTEALMDTIYPQYVKYDDVAPGHTFNTTSTGVIDAVQSMYAEPSADAEGRSQVIYTGFPDGLAAPDALEKVKSVMPVLLASGVKKGLGLDAQGLAAVAFSYRLRNGAEQATQFLVQPRALLDRLPGFPGISPRRTSVSSGTVIMTVANFARLIVANQTDFANAVPSSATELAEGGISEVRYEKLLIRVMPGVASRQRSFFLNSLQAHLSAYHSSSTDVQRTVDDVQRVTKLLLVFYYFSAAVCVLLASLMTWMVFVSNVTQNAWTFGVLRSLGFTKAQVLRAVVYEALVMILSSFSIGLPIGMFVGYTLGLQMSTFLNLPYQFHVSYPTILVLLGVSILATVLGSAIPMRSLNKMQIAKVVKTYN